MKHLEASYENGSFQLGETLNLRAGERVNLIVIRRPDPRRWDFEHLSKASDDEDITLAELGLADWAASLDAEDRS